ncbi:hypothetical protein VIC_002676 [Vibrio coralliilyticus ATCC BAA-450]|nr:hypothetical protein VIC_002676 [Vibrio coralliilyticus ATCC BAA-450]MDE3897238.1 hypothetical protein [Vibrio sp. CC007]
MESSKTTNQDVINLGKAIIAELDMEIECNTPARWMVHYIAENINKASHSDGDAKDTAERNCVDAIIKLWQHRSELPRGIRPFTEFDSVFQGLSRLDSSSSNHYYNEFLQFDEEIDDEESTDTKQWVNVALTVDQAAKSLVSECFEKAAQSALTEKSKSILQLAPKSSGDDIKVLLSFLDDEIDENTLKEKKIADIESKIARIQSLKEACDVFLESYKGDLEELVKRDIT